MKSYNLQYDLSKRASKTVYVSQNSTFQIGIKCKYGDTFPIVELYKGGTEKLDPAGTVGSYRTWQLTSGEAEAEDAYEAECMGVRLPLKVVTTRSTVAELPSGESPDLSEYAKTSWVEENYTNQNDFYASEARLQADIEGTATTLGNMISQLDGRVTSINTTSQTAYSMAEGLVANAFTLSGTYEDGTEFSLKAAGIKA